jgi:poly(ADP-ribose) glycohydrolase
VLATNGVPAGSVTYSRLSFPRNAPPWTWDDNPTPLCAVELVESGSMYASPSDFHVVFANKFVGGGCLENDFASEEMLFVSKPEMIVAMCLCSHMTDEDCVLIAGALQFAATSGHGSTFEFEGDVAEPARAPATMIEIDALQGCAKIQFQEGLVRRDLNKARIGFARANAATVATGFWGCGAFGNDHWLKFLQQWLAASDAGVQRLSFFTFGDKRADGLADIVERCASLRVGQLWRIVMDAASQCATPAPGNSAKFKAAIVSAAAVSSPQER